MLPALSAQNALFPSTRWTRVLRAQEGPPEDAARAMEEICRDYWYPVYAFLRRGGNNSHDAEDLTQSFFLSLVAEDALRNAREQGGRLRSFLLGVLMRTLSDHARHHGAQKRGGGRVIVSLDSMDAEERYEQEPRDNAHPEALFSRVWARELLASVRAQLRQTFVSTGREHIFDAMAPFLLAESAPPPHSELAALLGSSVVAARVLIFRTRHKFRELLQQEVAKTVASPEEVQAELAWLHEILAEN